MDSLYDQYRERLCKCLEDEEELDAIETARREIVGDLLLAKTMYMKAAGIVGGFRKRARQEGLIKY